MKSEIEKREDISSAPAKTPARRKTILFLSFAVGLLAMGIHFHRLRHDALRARPNVPLGIPCEPQSASVRAAPVNVYPYSVAPGGVHSAAEAVEKATLDHVIRAHYADVDLRRLKGEFPKTALQRYVSYRVDDRVYWTRKPLTIAADEMILTDGTHEIRSRCGNRLAERPKEPTMPDEPVEEAFALPVPPGYVPFASRMLSADLFTLPFGNQPASAGVVSRVSPAVAVDPMPPGPPFLASGPQLLPWPGAIFAPPISTPVLVSPSPIPLPEFLTIASSSSMSVFFPAVSWRGPAGTSSLAFRWDSSFQRSPTSFRYPSFVVIPEPNSIVLSGLTAVLFLTWKVRRARPNNRR